MSGDHNMYQKTKSYLDDFECPRCGHCCQAEVSKDMKHIKTWSERCEEHPDHQERIITERMIQERMQEEIDELRQALETEQEPVCWTVADGWVYANDTSRVGTSKEVKWETLYTAPTKREWVGLTDEEINSVRHNRDWTAPWTDTTFARAVEQALKEKNT